jgi:hypothetical protein
MVTFSENSRLSAMVSHGRAVHITTPSTAMVSKDRNDFIFSSLDSPADISTMYDFDVQLQGVVNCSTV